MMDTPEPTLEPTAESTSESMPESMPAPLPIAPPAPPADPAEVWSSKLPDSEAFSRDVFWLAVPEVLARYNLMTAGAAHLEWQEAFLYEYFGKRLPVPRMLSLGCGTGTLERALARRGAFVDCDAYDIAPGALRVAEQQADLLGLHHIHYMQQDLNCVTLPPQHYDAVWFHMALHHITNLEHLLAQIRQTLKPDGFLFLNEYIGPNRFDFTPRQKEVLIAAFTLIPQRFRRYFGQNGPEYVIGVGIPDPAAVQAADDSESVRSAEIVTALEQHFEIVTFRKAGGTLLQFLLNNIAGNFRRDDPESIKVLEMLFTIEDTLIEVGDLDSDFVAIGARPKAQTAPPDDHEPTP